MPTSDVLLIDDEPDLRECIAELLESEGYTVKQAENGKTGLEILKSGHTPKVIVLDYMMPVMDGKTFCEHAIKDQLISAIPIILLTAANVPAEMAADMKVASQLEKPIDIEKFLNAVKTYLSKPA
ncbi:response regulator [Pseudobdellovibrio sp. HCB154]|uniref:response regulator n=1 Tax=Pseudobdellovibrio sp. HCB154 TaxID=3386277 RepID=UPI0039171310